MLEVVKDEVDPEQPPDNVPPGVHCLMRSSTIFLIVLSLIAEEYRSPSFFLNVTAFTLEKGW